MREEEVGIRALEPEYADVGGVGHTGTVTADELARTADLVIGVGTRYTDFTTASGTLFTGDGVRFLNLNIAPSDGPKLAGLPLVADARGGLQQLTEALGTHGYRVPDSYVAEYTEDKERWEQRVDACYEAEEPDVRPTQPQVLGALDAIVDETDVEEDMRVGASRVVAAARGRRSNEADRGA